MNPVRSWAGVAVLLLAASCSSDSPTPEEEGADAMAHIHGIGVDPADGALYAATHTGLFRIDGRKASRVANRWQDTMAFTVAGPNHFLASGHPGAGDDRPPHLGLIESMNAGKTWKALALEGRADFHALDLVGSTLYGYDSQSGQLMSTKDQRTFRPIGSFALADIAADPRDTGVVLATTETGLVAVDADSGKTTPLDAPRLVFIDWPKPKLLVGIDQEGTVHVSSNSGRSWKSRGRTPGQPAALEVTEQDWYSASAQGLFRSADSGATWKPVGPRMQASH
jgi:hypothetical protein